ncbi:MAG: hypothetical protein ACR5K7_00955 [Symbiopectobacterium sp.]
MKNSTAYRKIDVIVIDDGATGAGGNPLRDLPQGTVLPLLERFDIAIGVTWA